MLQATEVAVCTDNGRAVLELADEAAPQHVASFLRYVDMGYYSGTVFHRVQSGLFVQGGGLDRELRVRSTLPPVANESSNGLRNTRGSVAAARTEDPDSARSQFFVNLADNTQLDGGREPGYTVFAHVKEGIEVFEAIGRLPTGAAGPFPAEVPTPLVAIKSIARARRGGVGRATGRRPRGRAAKPKSPPRLPPAMRPTRCASIGQYRALCGADDPEIALTEARMALAGDDRRRALFALEELMATTDPAEPAHAAAMELYREAATDSTMTSELVAACAPPAVPALPDASRSAKARWWRRNGRCASSWPPPRPISRACRASSTTRTAAAGCATRPSRSTTAWSRRWKRSPRGSTSRSASSKRAAEAARR